MSVAMTTVALAVVGVACKTTTTTGTGGVTPAEIYIPPEPYVFESFSELTADLFAEVEWGSDDGAAVVQRLKLARYDLIPATWGARGELPALEVTTPRRASSTTLLLDPADGTVRSVLIRGLPAIPAGVEQLDELLPDLAAYPGKLLIYAPGVDGPADDAGQPVLLPALEDRFVFVQGLGVKIGLVCFSNGLWQVDHVEYFDPAWGPEQMASYKYGGRLVEVDTIGALERRTP